MITQRSVESDAGGALRRRHRAGGCGGVGVCACVCMCVCEIAVERCVENHKLAL